MLIKDLLSTTDTECKAILNLDASIEKAIKLMRSAETNGLFVMGKRGLHGFLFKDQLQQTLIDRSFEWNTPLHEISQIISQDFTWAHPEQRLIDCLCLMEVNELTEIPIIRDRTPQAILNIDLVRKATKKSPESDPHNLFLEFGRRMPASRSLGRNLRFANFSGIFDR